MGGHDPRWAFHLDRSRRKLAARRELVEQARAGRMVRRRLRLSRHPFDLHRPARQPTSHRGDLLRRRLADARRRRELVARGERHARRIHAAGAPRRPEHPGPPPRGAMPRAARSALGPAPQRHLPLHRRRGELARGRREAAREIRLRRGGASERRRHRVVRARAKGRAPRSGRRRAVRGPNARRRQIVSSFAQRIAAGAGLRPRLPPWPRRGRDG